MSAPDDAPGLADFVAALFEPDDLVELRALPEPVRRRWLRAEQVPTFHITPVWRAKNVHFGPNPRRRKGGTAADVALARCLFVDIERVTTDEAMARLARAALPEPTAVVASGGGIHAYWRLSEPMADLEEWTVRQKALITAIASDPSVHDPPRVMRLPGTLNHKYEPPRVCELIACSIDARHSLDAFPKASPRRPVATDMPARAWSGSSSDLERRAAAYLDRIPPAISGSGGHGQTYAAATALVHGFGLEPAVAFALLRDQYNQRCQPPWSDKELMHKINDAASKPHDRPFGYLRGADSQDGGSPVDLSRLMPSADAAPATSSAGAPAVDAAANAEMPGPVLRCLADVEPREVRWLWPGRVPLGRLTLLVGRPGEGKSFLTTDMASRVSTGRAWPDDGVCPGGSVILVSAEDDPHDTIRPRLDAHGADVRRVHLLATVRRRGERGRLVEAMFTLEDLPALEAALQRHRDCRLIVIDPIGSFIGGGTDSHRDNEVRAVLAPVAQLAERYGPAVLIVAHRRKSTGTIADDLAIGSRAFTGIARAVWHLTRDRDDKRRRLLLSGKNNLAPEGTGLAFDIGGIPPAIQWEASPVNMRADDALAAESDGGDGGALTEATDFLRSELANGRRAGSEVKAAAKAAGISNRTLDRARARLGVVAAPDGYRGPWTWAFPHHTPPDSTDTARGQALANSGELGNVCLDAVSDMASPAGGAPC